MIATSGFYPMDSDTGYYFYPSLTSNYIITAASQGYDFYYRGTIEDEPDPKRRKPFYREVIALNAPAIPPLKISTPKKRQWNPSMGRVRINRT